MQFKRGVQVTTFDFEFMDQSKYRYEMVSIFRQ
jgi:hypothetical protein